MSLSTIIGSLGVTLLLVAFFLNLFKFISQESSLYILLNIIGPDCPAMPPCSLTIYLLSSWKEPGAWWLLPHLLKK